MADIPEVVITGHSFPNIFALPVSAKIGDLDVQTNIEEVHSDALEITEHPVESGAAITDHSYRRPSEVILRCGWSNSSLAALTGIITGFFSGGKMSKSDYVSGIYSRLLALKDSREPFTIVTSLRQYDNMLIRSLNVTRDQKTSQILNVEATCREVILVFTESATLPPKENQANPESTAETANGGTKQAATGFPAPGGSVPSNEW